MKRLVVVLFVILAMFLPWRLNGGVALAAPTLSASPPAVAPGGTVILSGDGYTPNAGYTVSVGNAAIGTASADNSGHLTFNLSITGGTPSGTYIVTVSFGQTVVASTSFQVSNAQLSVQPNPVAAGNTVTITGTGFAPNTSLVAYATVNIAGSSTPQTVTAPVAVSGNGTFSVGLAIPGNTTPGSYIVHLSASVGSGDIAETSLNVSAPPSPPTAGLTGATVQTSATATTVTVGGTGFGANEVVQVTYTVGLSTGGTVTEQVTGTTNGTGAFTVSNLPVPANAVPGSYTITAVGETSHHSATAQLEVVSVGVNPATVGPGATTTIQGSGFAPNTQLTVYLPVNVVGTTTVQTISAPVTVAGNGTFTTTLTVPANTVPNTYIVHVAASTSGPDLAHGSLTVSAPVSAAIILTPATVTAGSATATSIRGTGFAPGELVQISYTANLATGGTAVQQAAATADAAGAFTASLAVPAALAPGVYTVTARGTTSGRTATAALTLSPHPVLSLGSTVVLPGRSVSVSGSQFAPNAQVTVVAHIPLTNGSTATITRTAVVNAAGRFTLQLPLPANAAAGTIAVAASQVENGITFASTANLTIQRLQASVSLSPTSVLPGQVVTVSGSGFSANAAITVRLVFPLYSGGSRVVSVVARTGPRGRFQQRVTVPSHAAAGAVSVAAAGPAARATTTLQVRALQSVVTISPASITPGGKVVVQGSGYPAGDHIAISVPVTLRNGGTQTLSASAVAGPAGRFSVNLPIPANVRGGATYTLVARSAQTGRAPTAHLVVGRLSPSLIVVPTTAVPGSQATVSGFGFVAGAHITLSLKGQNLTTVTAGSDGRFSVQVMIPATLASGTYPLQATSASGRVAGTNITVNRKVTTRYYFAGFYTGKGYHEYLTFLNPSPTLAHVTITYEPISGRTHVKAITINPHSRFNENVNADLGFHVSAGAVVASDVPIAVERVVYHGQDGSDVPGRSAPSTIWYFANGNTSHHYREFLAIQNPNSAPVRVTIRLSPTHSKPITIYRNVAATARTTVKVNSYVNDAVGVMVTSSAPVLVNRSVFIHRGMTSKLGIVKPQPSWFFAAGPQNPNAHNWIGVTNPSGSRTYLVLRAFGQFGRQIAIVRQWLKPYARVGYLMNKIAHQTDVSVIISASRGIIAEQMTYAGRLHNAQTDTFGVPVPSSNWNFAAVNTTFGQSDILDLFNPGNGQVPVVVQFMAMDGKVAQRTYVIAPHSQQHIDAGTVMPNTQLGIVAAANQPFVAMNRAYFNNRRGSMTSTGLHLQP